MKSTSMSFRTGDKVVIYDVEFGHELSLVVEVIGCLTTDTGPFLLARAEEPYQRMHLTTKGIEFKSSTPNRDNMLVMDFDANVSRGCGTFAVRSYNNGQGNSKTVNAHKCSCCLAVTVDGELVAIPFMENQEFTSVTEYGVVCSRFSLSQQPNKSLKENVFTPFLKQWQLRRFVHEGYIHLPNIISADRINHCVSYLTHHMGKVGCLVPGGVQGDDYGKFPGQISNSEIIRNLVLKSQVLCIVEELFGCSIHRKTGISAQIAFRYPQFRDEVLEDQDHSGSNIGEEIEWHTDGYRQGHSHPFSILLGVSLSKLENDYEGNLSVWPGSHFLLHRCRKDEYGGLDLEEMCNILLEEKQFADLSHSTQLEYRERLQQMKVNCGSTDIQHNNSSRILPSLGEPLQILTNPGDVVLLHPDLAHGGAPNYSPLIRQMLYFRLKIDHGEDSSSKFRTWEEVIERQRQDMWADFLGLKASLTDEELSIIQSIYVKSKYSGVSL